VRLALNSLQLTRNKLALYELKLANHDDKNRKSPVSNGGAFLVVRFLNCHSRESGNLGKHGTWLGIPAYAGMT
jgi:hypothetical protein